MTLLKLTPNEEQNNPHFNNTYNFTATEGDGSSTGRGSNLRATARGPHLQGPGGRHPGHGQHPQQPAQPDGDGKNTRGIAMR